MPDTKLPQRLHQRVWETDPRTLNGWQRKAIFMLRVYIATIRDMAAGLPSLRAMGLVYTTLLSMVPLLAVSFSVLKGFGAHNQLEPALLNLLSPLGEKSGQIVEQVIGFVDNMKVGALGAFGLLMLIFTVLSLVKKIESAFNFTWKIRTTRNMAQRFSNYLSVIMVGPVLIFSAIGLTATVNHSSVIHSILAIEPFGSAILLAGKLLPFILTIATFTFIYILVPNTKVAFRSALVGALNAGIIWELTSWLFTGFIANSSNYTAIYSSFAILIIFMLWVYASWLILLTGASIAFYHQHPERTSSRQQVLRLSCRLREKLALTIMKLIAHHFHHGKPAWSLPHLSRSLDIAEEAIELVVQALQDAALLIRVEGKPDTWLPARSLNAITVYQIFDAIRKAEESPSLNPHDIAGGEAVERLLKNLDDHLRKTLENTLLSELVQEPAE